MVSELGPEEHEIVVEGCADWTLSKSMGHRSQKSSAIPVVPLSSGMVVEPLEYSKELPPGYIIPTLFSSLRVGGTLA